MYRGLEAYLVRFPGVCQSRGLILGSSCLSHWCFSLDEVPPVTSPQQGFSVSACTGGELATRKLASLANLHSS